MEKAQKITKEMTIREAIQKYPKTTSVFIDYGLHCIGCPIAAGETIEEMAEVMEEINARPAKKNRASAKGRYLIKINQK